MNIPTGRPASLQLAGGSQSAQRAVGGPFDRTRPEGNEGRPERRIKGRRIQPPALSQESAGIRDGFAYRRVLSSTTRRLAAS